jgi:hypothetical protein
MGQCRSRHQIAPSRHQRQAIRVKRGGTDGGFASYPLPSTANISDLLTAFAQAEKVAASSVKFYKVAEERSGEFDNKPTPSKPEGLGDALPSHFQLNQGVDLIATVEPDVLLQAINSLKGDVSGVKADVSGVKAQVDALQEDQRARQAEAERNRLRSLIIRRGPPSKSSPSVVSAHSADNDAPMDVKIRVLRHYRLLVDDSDADKKNWTCRSMLHEEGAVALPLPACTVAHLWPKSMAHLADAVANELRLPDNFYKTRATTLCCPKTHMMDGITRLLSSYPPETAGFMCASGA